MKTRLDCGKTFVITTILLFLFSGLPVLSGATIADTCESCHSGPNPDGDYVYQPPLITLECPSIIAANDTFRLSLVVTHNGFYEVEDFKASIDLTEATGLILGAGEDGTKSLSTMGMSAQTHGLTWKLLTTSTDTVTIKVQVNFKAKYVHTAGTNDNEHRYTDILEHEMKVADLPFTLDPTSIDAKIGKSQAIKLTITAKEDLYNLEVLPGLSVKNFTTISPTNIGTLKKGQRKTVTITMDPDRKLEYGEVVLIWSLDKEGLDMVSLKIDVTIAEDSGGQGGKGKNILGPSARLAGRILGFVCLILMITLAPTGGTFQSWRKKMNQVFGKAKRRISFHCATSYLLFTLTLLHAALLMLGHYRSLAMYEGLFLVANADVPSINIGTVAFILMIVISLLGIFQKGVCKAMSYKNWCRVHGWITWTAIILIFIHLFWVGTTLGKPLREALL